MAALAIADLNGAVRLWRPGAVRLEPDLDGSREKTIGWNGLVSAGPNLGYLGPGAVRILKANGGRPKLCFRATPTGLRLHSIPRERRSLRVAARATDRKSTRLNSSHLGISYAVFCL